MATSIDDVIAKLNEPSLQSRISASVRNAIAAELKKEGIVLTPQEWGEITARIMTGKRDAGDVLAGAAAVVIGISISDRRVKENIVKLQTNKDGIDIYEFSYLGFDSRWRGVIAQDIERTHPDAIIKDKQGMLSVNYHRIGLRLEQGGDRL